LGVDDDYFYSQDVLFLSFYCSVFLKVFFEIFSFSPSEHSSFSFLFVYVFFFLFGYNQIIIFILSLVLLPAQSLSTTVYAVTSLPLLLLHPSSIVYALAI